MFTSPFEETRCKLALYHNYIDIDVKLNGNQINMKGIEVNSINNDNLLESNSFKDLLEAKNSQRLSNIAKLRKGTYGKNVFEITIPKEYLSGFSEDIKLSFGQFNTNWWHVNKYIIDVDIETVSKESVNVTLSQKISHVLESNKVLTRNDEIIKQLTISDASISVFAEGP